MIRRTADGLVYYQFESLPSERVMHGVFTRLGGVSKSPFDSLNLSVSVPDRPSHVEENRRRFYTVLGADPARSVRTMQVHGARVATVDPSDAAIVQRATDGLLTDCPDLPLVMAFADCTPVMLYDPIRSAIGIAHAGWRGTVAGICQAAVADMVRCFGSNPSDIRAAIGPAIGPCCYEVGPDLVEHVRVALGPNPAFFHVPQGGGGRVHFDQWSANEFALRQAGVQMVERADICTACQVHEFYSHRAEAGRTGRFGAAIFLRDGGMDRREDEYSRQS